MIIVNLKGGLGNQMFQYACARALSLRHGEALKLDPHGFEAALRSDTPRKLELGGWNAVGEVATPEEVRALKYPYGPISKAARLFRAKVLRRFYISFSPRVLSWKGGVYLDGFFQSEEYFKDFAGQIRADFTPRAPLSPASAAAQARIDADPRSVSLHVRRGDYATTASAEFGTLPLSYYEAALARIRETVAEPRVYVFSDDVAWARENLSLPAGAEFVSAKGTPLFEEVWLMSRCRHHVIANSSFSWWGAWLDARPDKVVVAPKAWARKHQAWYKDITPTTWIRL